MYLWYKRIQDRGRVRLIREEKAFLGGCNNGVIANALRNIIKPNHNPPLGWEVSIADEWNKEDYSFIVDIKPNSSSEIFLCEVDRVFGYSFNEWSPIMLRLKVIYDDVTENTEDKSDFFFPEDPYIIYTMLYLQGSIRDGKLVGTWSPPFGSITALLFWPEAMTYFYEQAQKFDPEFLTANIRTI